MNMQVLGDLADKGLLRRPEVLAKQLAFNARQIPPAWLWVIPRSLRTLGR